MRACVECCRLHARVRNKSRSHVQALPRPFTSTDEAPHSALCFPSQDTHIILACDGVWDVMTDQEAVEFTVNKAKSLRAELEDRDRRNSVDTAGLSREERGLRSNVIMRECAKALVTEVSAADACVECFCLLVS